MERYIVTAAYVPTETRVTVVGTARDINTGFAAAIEAEGWRCREVPDVQTLLEQPRYHRTLIVVRIATFTAAAHDVVRRLVSALGLPVVVFSGENHPDVVRALLQAGADDFLYTPVTIEEMIARLWAVIRVRFGDGDGAQRSDYRVDETALSVSIADGPSIRLSLAEYRLFRILFAARNRPVARERLAALPLLQGEAEGRNALDAAISRLRRKLGADRVVTVRGVGYQLVDGRQTRQDGTPARHLVVVR